MRGLRLHLLLSAARRRAPLLLLLLGLAALAKGGRRPGLLTISLLAGVTHGLQRLAAYVASAIIMAGSRELLDVLESMSASELVRRWLPGFRAGARTTIEQFARMRRELAPMRAVLLAPCGGGPGGGGLGGERVQLRTPDGGTVDGIVYGRAALVNCVAGTRAWDDGGGGGLRGLVVYLGGNGEHYELRPDMAAWPRNYGLAVLLRNYRGYGESPGTCTREGAVVEVATALAFAGGAVADGGLGVPAARTVALGHSIGGALATEAAPFFPGVLLVNDRSLARLSTEAQHLLLRPFCSGPAAATWLAIAARWALATIVRNVAAWEMEPVDTWRSLSAGRKLVVFHAADAMIPPAAQLATALLHADVSCTPEQVGCVMDLTGPASQNFNAHNRDFSASEKARLFGAFALFFAGKPLGERC